MPDLTRLRQHLNRESHGGHKDNGASQLHTILTTIDEMQLNLEEQERWIRDGYTVSDTEMRDLANEAVQTFLSTLLTNVADFGEDYLVRQLCVDNGYEALAEALKRYQESVEAAQTVPEDDALGDLDDHPF